MVGLDAAGARKAVQRLCDGLFGPLEAGRLFDALAGEEAPEPCDARREFAVPGGEADGTAEQSGSEDCDFAKHAGVFVTANIWFGNTGRAGYTRARQGGK